MGRIQAHTRKWRKIVALTEEIHDKENLTNEQAQDKILELLKQQNQ